MATSLVEAKFIRAAELTLVEFGQSDNFGHFTAQKTAPSIEFC